MLLRQWTAVVLLITLFIAGCGGGGGSSSSPAAAKAGLFVTSAGGTRAPGGFAAAYDHIWVTIKKVTFDGTNGAVVAYNDPTGAVIDLKTLRDVNGAKFALLGTIGLPAGTYSDFKVLLSKDISLIPAGGTTATAAVFAGFDVATGTKELVKTFTTAKAITNDFCVDFDISSWTIDNASPPNVTASIQESDQSGIGGGDRHIEDDFGGTVANLAGTAPTQTFSFTTEEGFTVNVATSAVTSIFSSDGAPSPALANGQHVQVKGVFDVITHVFNASAVMIEVGNHSENHASGVPSAGDAVAGTFTLTVHEVEGFVPTGVSIAIATTPTTKFFNGKGTSLGVTEFFTALATATNVEVNGSFDVGTQTMTALSIRLEGDSNEGEAHIQGAVSNGNAGALTFDIVATHFEGLNIPQGSTVHILVTNTTELIGADRSTLTTDAFFTALGTSTGAEVEGTYDAGTQVLTAKRAKLNSASMGDMASVDGVALNVNGSAYTFSLTVFEWEDANLSVGAQVDVTTDNNTVYRDAGGNMIDRATFFTGAAAANARVRVEGPITNLTMVARLARLLPADH